MRLLTHKRPHMDSNHTKTTRQLAENIYQYFEIHIYLLYVCVL